MRLTVVTGLADWSLTGSTVTASAGQAKFTGVGLKSLLGRTSAIGETFRLTAAATGLTSATSDSFGPAGPTAKLAFTSSLPCGLVANPGCSPAAKAGQQFTITVAAQDASGQVNSNENGLVTLTSDGTSGMTARNAPFVSGVATFAGVVFTSASTTGFTLTATSGALTVSSGRIVVTADNTPASLRFIAVPTHEASGVAFVTDPQVEVLNAAGQRITNATGTVALSLHKQDGTTTSALLWDSGTTTSQALTLGTARFPGLRVTGASTGLYLKATLGTLEANQTGTIRVHADAASATMARVSEQSQSSPLSLTLNIDKALPGSLASNAVKNDVCKSLLLPPANCGVQVTVTSAALTAAVVVTDESGQVLAITQMAAPADEETVTVGPVNRRAFEAETGATAPAGTSVLYTVGRIATDAFGNRLAVLRKPQRFSLPVPESVLLPGALPGDLKVAWWDGARWTVVPSATAVNEDGSYTVTANTDALGVFAVLYAPGAGRVQGFGGFSTQSENGDAAVGLGIFAGGSTTALAHAVGLSGADGVWVQDAGGEFRLLLANGPAFVSAEFHRVFADGLAPNTIVLLVRAPRA